MTQVELYTILKKTGISTCYHSWKASGTADIPDLPWLCYLVVGTKNEAADGQVWAIRTNCNIELYTDNKDLDTEEIVETALNDACIFWDKTETYIDDECMYCVVYSIQI